MAPDRAAHRRRVQTGAAPRGTGAYRQPVPGVVPTRPVDAGGRGDTRLVSEISRELARVNVPARALKVSGESPLRASRDTLIQKIRYMTTRVKEIEPRLKESEQRIKDLTTLSDSLRNDLASTSQNLH